MQSYSKYSKEDMERIIKDRKRVETTVIVYILVGRNLDEAHHTVCLKKTKMYMNNAVVILTYSPHQKTLKLLKLLYFFKGENYYSAIFIESKLGSVDPQKLQTDAQIKKKICYQ